MARVQAGSWREAESEVRGDEMSTEGEKGGATTMEAITKAKSPGFLKKIKIIY